MKKITVFGLLLLLPLQALLAQQEFADAFEYELTPDQQAAIADITRDMESPTPLDRASSTPSCRHSRKSGFPPDIVANQSTVVVGP
mgnify:CR=1 FL=1